MSKDSPNKKHQELKSREKCIHPKTRRQPKRKPKEGQTSSRKAGEVSRSQKLKN